MKDKFIAPCRHDHKWRLFVAAFLINLLVPLSNYALTLNVVDDLNQPITNYRWQLEEDNTSPGVPGVAKNDTVSLVIHKSHAPVLASGNGSGNPTSILVNGNPPDLNKRYIISVLAENYTLGGASITNNQTTVTVVLHAHAIPTAQISILVYHDTNSINNAPDATEAGLPGFRIMLSDFAGGPIMQDAFGNPLGTVYGLNSSGEPDSSVITKMGDGNIYTDANGKALVKYLPMGKFGIKAIPPTGQNWKGGHATPNVTGAWHQTATIEGTPTIDAWVTANEPMVFIEGFGPGFYHAFFGFVDPAQMAGLPATTTPVTVKGTLRYNHFGRPPNNQQFVVGPPVAEGWVGLNEINALGLAGRGLYITPCDPETGEFSIPNVPPGTYQLVTWDKPLDALFGFNTITVPTGANTYDLGNVLSFRWFGTLEGSVFYDANQNGFRDPTEEGLPQQAVNLRWRDGTVYMATTTDGGGDYAMSEVFPFFKWLVAEVDFTRLKATGMTAVVDEGGGVPIDPLDLNKGYVLPPDNGWAMPSEGVRNPQPQYDVFPSGTQDTAGNDISGTIDISKPIDSAAGNHYSRTELGPVLTEGVHLFLNQNNRIDWGKVNYGPNENGGISGIVGYGTTRAEEDPRNAVIDAWEPGVPRVQVVLYAYDATAPVLPDTLDTAPTGGNEVTRLKIQDVNQDGQHTLADVDNYPFGWMEGSAAKGPEDIDRDPSDGPQFNPGDALQIVRTDSWDDVVAENPTLGALQPNPPVILGKSIIGSDNYGTWNQVRPAVFDGGYAFNTYFPGGMAAPTGPESSLPAGQYIVQAVPPPGYLIQTEESMNVVFGDAYKPSKLLLPPEIVGDYRQVGPVLTLFPEQNVDAPFANKWRPYADRKLVRVADGKNAACDFHIYTEVPKATRIVGFVLNDLTAEFNAKTPIFGEKGSPGWLPISFKDWAGHEVARTYSDEYGSYEALLPSTYTVNAPAPSGVAPNMLTLVLNDPTLPDGTPDPHYNPAFSTTPWTLHYYPGTFLYADTPIVPVAGFVGGPNKQLDVEPPSGTPVIKSVTTDTSVGPYAANITDVITIKSMGTTMVPNPAYQLNMPPGPNTPPATVARDYGFGHHDEEEDEPSSGPYPGKVTLTVEGIVTELVIQSWRNDEIKVKLPAAFTAPLTGQLLVTLNNGKTTPIGITLTCGGSGTVRSVPSSEFPTIQSAIDASIAGDLVLVAPGEYKENPILWKAIRLQGAGLDTRINANPAPADRLAAWHAKVATILGGDPFTANEAPGIMVLGNAGFTAELAPRIDGFHIKGALAGGGIVLYDQARHLRISNNRIIGNQGSTSGGISIGEQTALGGLVYRNEQVTIEYNQILLNGGVNGAGGIGIHSGATGYKIQNNYILGNFTRASGGGIGHEGLSPGGLIANNVIAFNEIFFGVPAGTVVVSGEGGGIYIAGELNAGGLSLGSGSVTIINNVIQGNLAGAGQGGGICATGINGEDTQESGDPADWYALDIFNNIIVNNVAGYAGGGISLQDATKVRIIHNTIANNDSTATARAAFPAGAFNSTAQGAGIVSHQHSAVLSMASGQLFCDPALTNNIVWHNRAFYWISTNQTLSDPIYLDLDVQPAGTGILTPVNCLLSGASTAPAFKTEYVNVLHTALVVDEAGNNISVRSEPIGVYTPDGAERGNYHLTATTAAGADVTSLAEVTTDFDNGVRLVTAPNIGADEFSSPIPGLTPPGAPAVTVAIVGPLPEGTPPPTTTPLTGAGVPPGPMVLPGPLNPFPTAMVNPLVDPEPTIDGDGNGITTDDLNYKHLAAGDGFVKMADGNELYCFGFSDQTELTLHHAAMDPKMVNPMVMMEGMLKAEFASPTIVLKEGQNFYLDLSNVGMMKRPDLFDPHTVHFHGFPQASAIFDGEPMASVSVNMGATLRYYYNIVEPGTYIYHCHVEATEHMEMGMIGNLWVEPKQNNLPSGTSLAGFMHTRGVNKYAYNDGDGSTRYDVEYPLQLCAFDRGFHELHIAVQPLPFWSLHENYPMINGRGYPDTINENHITNSKAEGNASQKVHSLVRAKVGQRVLLRISNVSLSDFHTLTVLGIPMKVVGRDARLLRGPTGINLSYDTTSVTLGGGETTDVILDTTGIAPGTYFIYDSRLNHLSNDEEDFGGMMTEIIIEP